MPTLYRWRAKFLEKMSWVRTPVLSDYGKVERQTFVGWLTQKWFEHLLITDEKWFYLNQFNMGLWKRGVYCLGKADKSRYMRTTSNRQRVQIWAGISLHHGCTPLVMCSGNVNSAKYC